PRRWGARGSGPNATDWARRWERLCPADPPRHAPPSRGPSTGEPGRRALPVSRPRPQQRPGSACLSPRSQRCARLFYAPRPYRRQAASLVIDSRNALLGLATHLATGQSYLRWEIPQPVGVLYIDGEMPLDELRQRAVLLAEQQAPTLLSFLSGEMV